MSVHAIALRPLRMDYRGRQRIHVEAGELFTIADRDLARHFAAEFTGKDEANGFLILDPETYEELRVAQRALEARYRAEAKQAAQEAARAAEAEQERQRRSEALRDLALSAVTQSH